NGNIDRREHARRRQQNAAYPDPLDRAARPPPLGGFAKEERHQPIDRRGPYIRKTAQHNQWGKNPSEIRAQKRVGTRRRKHSMAHSAWRHGAESFYIRQSSH